MKFAFLSRSLHEVASAEQGNAADCTGKIDIVANTVRAAPPHRVQQVEKFCDVSKDHDQEQSGA